MEETRLYIHILCIDIEYIEQSGNNKQNKNIITHLKAAASPRV